MSVFDLSRTPSSRIKFYFEDIFFSPPAAIAVRNVNTTGYEHIVILMNYGAIQPNNCKRIKTLKDEAYRWLVMTVLCFFRAVVN